MTTKNFLFTAVAVFTLTLGYWIYTNYSIVEKATDITTRSTTTTTQTARAQRAAQGQPTTLMPADNQTPPTTAGATTTPVASAAANTNAVNTAAITEQLELEKQKLELQRQNLAALKGRRETQLQQVSNVFPLQIGTNNLQIQNLLDDLQNQRLAANDVSDSANSALREQMTAAQYSKDQIDLNIQNVQQAIQATQQALAPGINTMYYNITDEQNRYAGLQTDLANLTEQLRQLKEQRVNISAQVFEQTRNINNLSQTQKAELTSNQNQIQEQISSLREENGRLQSQSTETRMSMMPLTQQISQAEQAYQESLDRVRSLEQSTVVR